VKKSETLEDITNELENWSDRKKTLFNNPDFIKPGVEKIQSI
jgi:hypothetical protein